MSLETSAHAEHDYRLNRSALMRRRGVGPWLREKGDLWKPSWYPCSEVDGKVNDSLGSKPLPVHRPNPFSFSIVDRLFYQVPGAQFSFYGQLHTFDMYVSAGELEPRRGRTPEDSVKQWKASDSYSVQTKRLDLAQWRGHHDSTVALTVLHNVARKAGRIGFVEAHGGDLYGEWHVFSDEYNSAPVDEVIQGLASKKDKQERRKYDALFFSACNGSGFSPDMNGIDIPVVAFTAINDAAAQGQVKVYFPL